MSVNVPYSMLNEPSSFNPVIILDVHDVYKRAVNDNGSVPITTSNPITTAAPPNPVTSNPTTSTTPFTVEVKDNSSHKYYKSKILHHTGYWDELNDHPSQHVSLTDGHRIAVTIGLSFEFPFYGHKVTKVTIATGGFLYMSPFLHSWLTATQYIAPLMANFDTRIGNGSDILYKDYTDRFVVEWRNVYLQDQNHSTPFLFQTTLHQNGTILFNYRKVPLDVQAILTDNHPVKIGVSDAFYVDATVQGVTRRTIYEYHRVEVNTTLITADTVVVLDPLPTCNVATSCESCVTQGTSFDCKWCPAVSRCSDGIDWYRQEWLNSDCTRLIKGKDGCNYQAEQGAQAVGGIIGIVLVLVILIGAIVGWFVYAYRNPTSASGMWLMEHRPSVMKQKIVNMKFFKRTTETGDKYKIESTATEA